VVDAVTAQEVGQGSGFSPGDFGGTEALLHEFDRRLSELGKTTFGLVEKAGKELVCQCVDAVGGCGLLTDQVAAATGDFTQVMIGGIRGFGAAGEAGPAGEQGFGNAYQIKVVGAGKEVFSVFLGFVSIDAHDEVILFAEGSGEVGDIGGFILAAEEDLISRDLSAAGSGRYLFDEEGYTRGVVLNREGCLEDVAVAVANERDVFALGVVEGDTEDLMGLACALEDCADVCVLVSIDGCGFTGCFHGTVKIPC